MKLNLPNKLSLTRILLVPVCILFLLVDIIPCNYFIALVVFAAASLTDLFDGKIARKRGLVTDMGKFLDPLADKLLVNAVLICFIPLGAASAVAVVIIIFREFAISCFRQVAAQKGVVMAANMWGKVKTCIQMIVICCIMFVMQLCDWGLFNVGYALPWFRVAVWVVSAVTIISVIKYFVDNKDCLKD